MMLRYSYSVDHPYKIRGKYKVVASLKCKNCGYENQTEARFCASCGAGLSIYTAQPTTGIIPSTESAVPKVTVEYMGFWIRFGAALIDSVVISFISFVLFFGLRSFAFGIGGFFNFFIPFLYYWLFTGLKGQTPGKMLLGIKVVNAEGSVPGLTVAALREIPGKILSYIAIFIGFLWIAWDRQKQGWHDKIANTHVVRVESRH